MQDDRSLLNQARSISHRLPPMPKGWALLVISAMVILAGGGTGWWAWNRLASIPDSPTTTQPLETDTTDSAGVPPSKPVAPIETAAVKVYLLDVADTNFELVPVTLKVESADDPSEILYTAFNQLLDGTTKASAGFSEIPGETTLLDLTVEDDGVHVDLSAEFEQGGGSASMTGRLAQVIYTATSLEPADPVWLSVEGTPLDLLGGEGLEISQPMTRAEFDENFPL